MWSMQQWYGNTDSIDNFSLSSHLEYVWFTSTVWTIDSFDDYVCVLYYSLRYFSRVMFLMK